MLTELTLSVKPGERAGIVGENGSGTSTLLRLLAGVERHDDGEVVVSGDVGYRGTPVVVSHDRALTRRFRGKELHLSGGRIC
ncbi:ATP-binding cassette domain-containing protein [Nonomuraea sp. NBC_00507]|uniref:ATP-binding cassette domain-containing protein n=1 Tax=Nonomuraea sp. NBC_00507 TaxID=2976002 RepID=UPI002E190BD9